METILAFIAGSVEAKRFGPNAPTCWAIGAGLVTLIQIYGTYKLARAVWSAKSGRGISLYMLGYWHATVWCFTYYAWTASSVTMLFNALTLGPLYSVAVVGILWFGGVRWVGYAKILLPLVAFPLAFMFIDTKDVLLLVLMCVGCVFFADQAYVLYKEKRVGAFDPRFTFALLVACVFWFLFALSVHDLALSIVNPIMFVISTVTLVAYYRAKRHEEMLGVH